MNLKAVVAVAGTIAGAVATAAAVKLYDLPTRVSVVESQQVMYEKRADKMDMKLDRILDRLPPRGR